MQMSSTSSHAQPSAAKKRWKKVVKGISATTPPRKKKTAVTEDALGEAIRRRMVLLERIGVDSEHDEISDDSWKLPLLSYHNYQVLMHKVVPTSVSRRTTRTHKKKFIPIRPSRDYISLFVFWCRLLVACWVLPCCLCGVALAYLLNIVWNFACYIGVMMIIDVTSFVPATIQASVSKYFQRGQRLVDHTVLFGFYFCGRDNGEQQSTLLTQRHRQGVEYCEQAIATAAVEFEQQHGLVRSLSLPELASPREANEVQSQSSRLLDKSNTTIEEDVPWIDVGTSIGLRILHSEHVQKAIHQDQHHRTSNLQPMQNQMKRPMHSMWNTQDHVKSHLKSAMPAERRAPLLPGVRVAIPLGRPFQMATVISSHRIAMDQVENALSVTVLLEKSYLRNGQFCRMTFRMEDANPDMPMHSKFPIGNCVSTIVGIGVLVGWRVRDDCHIVVIRGQRRRRLIAFLQRNTLWELSPAASDLSVETPFGWGVVVSTRSNPSNATTYHVAITDDTKYKSHVLELSAQEILACPNAHFLPIIEHVREAALYQMQVDQYDSTAGRAVRAEALSKMWNKFALILWQSFLKAIDEDEEFDNGVNEFMRSVVQFLDGLDKRKEPKSERPVGMSGKNQKGTLFRQDEIEVQLEPPPNDDSSVKSTSEGDFESWIWNDYFGGLFGQNTVECRTETADDLSEPPRKAKKLSYFERAYAVLRTLKKTVSLARAASVDEPHFRMWLAIAYDFLVFVHTVIRIQQRNVAEDSKQVWKRAWAEIRSTFGPIQKCLNRIGEGLAARMERQGRKAKTRLVKLIDRVLTDERLLAALEHGDWEKCLARLEIALVGSEVIKPENLTHYRKAASFVHEQFKTMMGGDEGAMSRNNRKLEVLGFLVQSIAAPKRSILKFLCRDDTMSILERILVRAYHKEQAATLMLTIHAANFHSLRHLRLLKDFSVSGVIWLPILNAADEELSWLVSKMPEKSKELMCPLSSLFSLCVAQFHKINAGGTTRDWLDFLFEADSVRIVQDINTKLILGLESFSKDIKGMIMVLPYYPSIDSDILNLMDEVNLDEFLKETAAAIDDPEKLSAYIREKATVAVERFLNYLPKMSIPVERRDLGEGWVITCHGSEGGDLTLTDVTIKRENLVCQVLGGDTLFFPMFTEDGPNSPRNAGGEDNDVQSPRNEEQSILEHIRMLIVNAEQSGCWKMGFGGVNQVLQGLPISAVLNCGIELWRDLEIDDDELLEIAIRDISYHIELKGKSEDDRSASLAESVPSIGLESMSFASNLDIKYSESSTFGNLHRRFNPRADATVLFLEIKRLTLTLDSFSFRIEPANRSTIFDPVFEGRGRLSLQNIAISLRVEVTKQRLKKSEQGTDISIPILRLCHLEVSMDKLQLTVTDTSFSSDWILNQAVTLFEENLTAVVEENLKNQIREQLEKVIDGLNSYFLVNPGLLLNLLGISMEDLDYDTPVWV